MAYNHIFFDLDHTLWDFNTNSRKAIDFILDDFGLIGNEIKSKDLFFAEYKQINEKCWDDYRRGLLHKDLLRVIRFRKTFETFGVKDQDLADRFGEMYIEVSPQQTTLIEGTLDVLDYLHGKYILHIMSNGFQEIQHIKLENTGIRKYFEEIILSEHVGEKKPHPLVFEHSLKVAGAIATESLMIGDNLEVDIIGARAAGMDGVYFNPENFDHDEEIAFEVNELREMIEFL